jgi:hypothetical protein
MHVKLTNGRPSQFPYTVGQLRRDNPHTSFPKQVPDEILAVYDVYPVQQVAAPVVDSKTHRVVQSVAQVEGGWRQTWTTQELPSVQAEANVRAHRNRLLSNTDWTALSDVTITPEMAAYRQALRDITSQDGFPYSIEWPVKPN